MSYHLSNLIPINILGHGKFSDVLLSKSSSSTDLYAVKIINKKKDTIFNTYSNFENELSIITILSNYNNPNILSTYSIISTNKLVYILNEYCEQGELTVSNFKYYPNNNSELDNIVSKLKNILSGIEFLHSLNIIHRDIKPSNLLLNSDGQVKLSDFDTCYQLSNNFKIDYQNIYNKLIGTPIFLPPEICFPTTNEPSAKKQPTKMSKKISNLFKNSSSSSSSSSNSTSNSNPAINLKSFQPFKIDVWSLGVTLYYLLFSKFPFYSDNEYLLFKKINDEIPFIPTNSDYPKHLTSTILKMLIKTPVDRISIKKIILDLNLVTNKDNNNLIKRPPIIIKNSNSDDLLYDSIMSNNNSNFNTIQLKLPIFQNEFVNTSTSSLPLPLVNSNDLDNLNNHQLSGDKNTNRNSIMTLPPNLNRSKSKLKHSSNINFKKYLPKDKKEKVDDIDFQLAKDYKIYTMDDYLGELD